AKVLRRWRRGLYRSTSALWPGNTVARVQPVQAPATGLFGLRSCRQHTVAPFGTSRTSLPFLRMTSCLVAIKPSPRLSQSARLVITSSTVTRSQAGSLRVRWEVSPELEEHAANVSTKPSQAPCHI